MNVQRPGTSDLKKIKSLQYVDNENQCFGVFRELGYKKEEKKQSKDEKPGNMLVA